MVKIEAGIAACHASAELYEDTDWFTICTLYDMLVEISQSPIVLLNRAVAVAMHYGVDTGLHELEPLRSLPTLNDYYLLRAVSAQMHSMVGAYSGAKSDYQCALECQCNTQEREFILRRLGLLQESASGAST